MEKLKSILKNENGGVSIVEGSIVMPVVFIIVCVLLIMGYYQLEMTTLHTRADRICDRAARIIAEPSYEYLPGYNSTSIDFESMPKVDDDLLKEIYKDLSPYRYWGSNSKKEKDLEKNLGKILKEKSYFKPEGSIYKLEIKPSKKGFSNIVKVKVSTSVVMPKFFKFIGLPETVKKSFSTVTYVSDSAEFIRNTDIVFDFTEFFCEKTGIVDNIKDVIMKIKGQFSFLGIKS